MTVLVLLDSFLVVHSIVFQYKIVSLLPLLLNKGCTKLASLTYYFSILLGLGLARFKKVLKLNFRICIFILSIQLKKNNTFLVNWKTKIIHFQEASHRLLKKGFLLRLCFSVDSLLEAHLKIRLTWSSFSSLRSLHIVDRDIWLWNVTVKNKLLHHFNW